MKQRRVFLLSPARCDGRRAKILLNDRADFALARELRTDAGATIGEVFSFLSGLYFRGKIAYAQTFADPPERVAPILVITTDRGLVPPETRIHIDDLVRFSTVDLASSDARFHGPLTRDADALAGGFDESCLAVLLGSIATDKYVGPLLSTFGERLVFPVEFIGRGDMSRGGLMLRHSQSGQELEYTVVAGAVRHGKRPPKLAPLRK
jgi:hypothetical protein